MKNRTIAAHIRPVFVLAASLPVPAMAHGVNCRGVMGAGVAKTVRGHWPALYEQYRQACRTGTITPGDMLAWQTPRGGWVYNLASQDRPGPNARLDWICAAVTLMAEHASTVGVSDVAIVRIGCGIGGLAWGDVRAALENLPGTLTLHIATPTAR